jgi:hypothetical protein
MQKKRQPVSPAMIARAATLLLITGIITAWLSSCATNNPTQPTPTATTNTVTLDEFFTPAPSGEADDYYVLVDGQDDVEYSYFLDEQDYLNARDVSGNTRYYVFIHDYVKRGHGYGDHNHIHEFVKGPHHYHGVYIGHRAPDWTDSLQLTTSEKVRIDTAMMHFIACSKADVDSFRVQLQPYRDSFRVRRLAIIAELDSNKITRDSARALLDSAIVKYEAETQLMRAGFVADLATCRAALDAEIQAILTPVQYQIWVRHRGW